MPVPPVTGVHALATHSPRDGPSMRQGRSGQASRVEGVTGVTPVCVSGDLKPEEGTDMSNINRHQNAFDCIHFERAGVLEMRLHSNGGPFVFSDGPATIAATSSKQPQDRASRQKFEGSTDRK